MAGKVMRTIKKYFNDLSEKYKASEKEFKLLAVFKELGLIVYNLLKKAFKYLNYFVRGVVYLIIFLFLYSWLFGPEDPDILGEHERAILKLDLDRGVEEKVYDRVFTFEEEKYDIKHVIDAIKQAAYDDRVRALLIKANNSDIGLAQAEELRNAILKFNQTGKHSIFFSRDIGGVAFNGTNEYFVASACSEIWVTPTAVVNLLGIHAQRPFFRRALDKLGIEPEFEKRYEYKTAADSALRDSITEAEKENWYDILSDVYDRILAKISKERGVSVSELKAYINNAPLTAEYAKKVHLVDRISYAKDLVLELQSNTNDARLFDAANYEVDEKAGERKVAYFVLDGMVIDDVENDPEGMGYIVASKLVSELLRAKEDKVEAVFIRINSTGGSYSASDEIWYTLEQLKKSGIKVVVSMGNYAASGGYYIAMAADKIVANPMTMTGSIGVYAGKVNFKDLWEKIYVNWDEMKFGENADFLSVVKPFSSKQRQKFASLVDEVYQDFVTKAGASRGMDLTKMDAIARGRVYTGEQAKEIGLVDVIGGRDDAIDELKKMMKLDEGEDIQLVPYYQEKFSLIDFIKGGAKKDNINALLREYHLGIYEDTLVWAKLLLEHNVLLAMEPIVINY
jgi:protease-4